MLSLYIWFESSVNSEGIETKWHIEANLDVFESSVNSEGIETELVAFYIEMSLRAV